MATPVQGGSPRPQTGRADRHRIGLRGAVQPLPRVCGRPARLGRHHRLHRPAGYRRTRQGRRRPLCPLLQEMARGDAGLAARRGDGEPRDTGAHRPPGHLQDHLAEQPAAARAAPLLLPEVQQPQHHARRPADALGVCPGVPRGAGRNGEQGAEPAEGAHHHAPRERTGGLCPLQGGAAPHCQLLRHEQQPPVPERPERQPTLDAFRGGEHRQPLRPSGGLPARLCPGIRPDQPRLSLLAGRRRDTGAEPAQPPLRSALPGTGTHPDALPPPDGGRDLHLRDERTDTGAHQRGPAPQAESRENRDGDDAGGLPADPRQRQAGLPCRRAYGR